MRTKATGHRPKSYNPPGKGHLPATRPFAAETPSPAPSAASAAPRPLLRNPRSATEQGSGPALAAPARLQNAGRPQVLQLKKWRVHQGKKGGPQLKPFGPGHARGPGRRAGVSYNPGQGHKRFSGAVPPADLAHGDIWDDKDGTVTPAELHRAHVAKKKARGRKRKRAETARQEALRTGEGFRSNRLKRKAEQRHEEAQRLFAEHATAAGVDYLGGDTDDELMEAGMQARVRKRIKTKHSQQLDHMRAHGNNPAWDAIPPEHQERILALHAQIREQKQPQVHHETTRDRLRETDPQRAEQMGERAERPLLSGARLVLRDQPHGGAPLHDDPRQGIGSANTDRSHSLARGQLPDELQHSEPGGANDPLNTPHENSVTNRHVNTALEALQAEMMAEDPDLIKIKQNEWNPERDRVARSVHFVFHGPHPAPLVTGIRDLEEKQRHGLDD